MKDGDQHRDSGNGATRNPFTTEPVSEFTALEIATLQARLDKQLGPEYISTRPNGGSGKVSYIEANKAITLANEVFGFNGWSSTVREICVDFVDERTEGRFNVGISVIVRVTLRDGTFHEDVGYGQIENCKGKAAAFEKCKKEGTTDAMKRALRSFGNVLGNCLYDKVFLKEIAKMKPPISRFDPEMLHRRPEFSLPADHPKMQVQVPTNNMPAPVMARRASLPDVLDGQRILRTEDSYDDDVFDGLEFDEDRTNNPDHVQMDTTIDSDTSINLQSVPQSTNLVGNTSNYYPPADFMKAKAAPVVPQQNGPRQTTMTQEEAKRQHALRAQAREKELALQRNAPAATSNTSSRPAPPPFRGTVPTEPVHPEIQGNTEPPADYQPSFMTSRSLVQPSAAPAAFDPKLQSPILQKSAIDHSKSTPIKRPGTVPPTVDSPAGNVSPLRRMGNQVTNPAPGFNVGMSTRSTQFRAPSKLNPGTSTGTTQKRGSDVLAEHPAGSITMNERVVSGSSDGGVEKKSKS